MSSDGQRSPEKIPGHNNSISEEENAGDLFGSDGEASDHNNTPGVADGSVDDVPAFTEIAMPKIPKRSRPAESGSNMPSSAISDGGDADNGSDRSDQRDDEAVNDDERAAQPADPKQLEIDEMNKKIDAALKSGRNRRRRRTDEDDASIDETIVNLRKRMRDAAYRDIDDNKDRLPAIHKLSMLPEVVEELAKTQLYEAFLDNNIVDSIRLWLEPLDDGSLPNLDIQNAMLDVLKKLPIRRDHLRESGIGKIILFMSRCPRISELNRRRCEQFVQQWSRMVLRLSSDYRDRRIKETTVDLGRMRYSAPRAALAHETTWTPGSIRIESGMDKNGERATARIPRRVAGDYSVMPVSSISLTSSQRRSGGRSATDKFKKLRQAISKGGH
ncbi:Transcription factor iws1 [Coemansia spiralis]|uniref:Transcription factor iws1 n=2 Tax=Coemansia TaxID=4863 RepID=A0A9W8KWA5_9FUNG|nr:hypothetical protein BX070DRAFT_224177 [Coemansia spiralis]KAJ1991960.1 Transcription factor iws1 [Coemansia umbellata]KAJ2625331.1 Transcription factor iws1 [Coemansia sp. RSA 1358]KAJ2676200.1 Transcription factor iws1 [Coemansia spiralis]